MYVNLTWSKIQMLIWMVFKVLSQTPRIEMWNVTVCTPSLGTSVSKLVGAPLVKEELLGDKSWALLENSGSSDLFSCSCAD